MQLHGHGDLLGVKLLGSTTNSVTGGCQPRIGALPNQISFKLGQGRKHMNMKDQVAARRGGIDCFGQRFEADVAVIEVGYGFDQLLEGSTQPLKAQNDQGVASA